jgi:hypothetical protein
LNTKMGTVPRKALHPFLLLLKMAEPTGLEPATSDVTGRRSNQLNYDSAFSDLKFQI